jgi:alpha-galactosidase
MWMTAGRSMPKTEEPTRDEDGRILCNEKFPDMASLTDYIHGLGLKAGIYTSPGPLTCAFYAGSWRHERQDARQFAEWGFDYLKYDWCSYSEVCPEQIAKWVADYLDDYWCSDSPEYDEQTLDVLKKPYLLMGSILKEVGRDIVFSLCQYGMGDVWKWSREVGGQCSRTTPDISGQLEQYGQHWVQSGGALSVCGAGALE